MRRAGIGLIAIVALLAGFYWSTQYFTEPLTASVQPKQGNLVGKQRPDFRLASHTGELINASDFTGKTLLVNFWATWCTPCRHEMPMLMDMQREYGSKGFQVVGIALDDVQSVRDFIDQYGISYPILVGQADVMAASAEYGNVKGVLPYSVLVDKTGIIRWQYSGEIHPEDVSRWLDKLL
jgi:peroxiredoxin